MEILAAVTGALGVYFTGVTAVANITTAYLEYRKSLPRRNQTGARSDYVQLHFGYNIKLLQQQNPFYLEYTNLLPTSCKRGFRSSLKRMISRTRSMSASGREPEEELEGKLELTEGVQRATYTHRDEYVGLNTGRQPMYKLKNAENHWATLEDGSACGRSAAPTIAVFNWTTHEITMFIKNMEWEPKEMFFKKYQVRKCNLTSFAKEFQNQMVFSGIVLKDGRLVGTSSDIFLAEDDLTCKFKSTNGWKLLGLLGETGKECMFLEMERAVLFGLIECIYKDPTLVNVDMLDGGNGSGKEFVHVDTPDPVHLSYRDASSFSIFAFNALDYSKERMLVG